MESDIESIIGEIRSHKGLFALDREQLGQQLVDAALTGVMISFDAEQDPEGNPWGSLQPGYQRWKERHFPGLLIGVQTGLMRSEIGGSQTIGRDSAEYTAGTTDQGREEISWFTDGDPENNRVGRPFVDLNQWSIEKSDSILQTHFDEGIK